MNSKMLSLPMAMAIALLIPGCTAERPPKTIKVEVTPQNESADLALDDQQAAELAAKLANDECERLYGERPFLPDTYPMRFTKDRYEWGRLDPRGINGMSAEVNFTDHGKEPRVRVYFSSDQGYVSD
ncbi:MAG: hypothetical protein SGI88_05730 [Candidatus Hydrogenedentes bacterium]|nr:hypothetical protein [Candidatus Hydrogenedentota bacterium]